MVYSRRWGRAAVFWADRVVGVQAASAGDKPPAQCSQHPHHPMRWVWQGGGRSWLASAGDKSPAQCQPRPPFCPPAPPTACIQRLPHPYRRTRLYARVHQPLAASAQTAARPHLLRQWLREPAVVSSACFVTSRRRRSWSVSRGTFPNVNSCLCNHFQM